MFLTRKFNKTKFLRKLHQDSIKKVFQGIDQSKVTHVIQNYDPFCLHLCHTTFLQGKEFDQYLKEIKKKYILDEIYSFDKTFEHGIVKLLFTTDKENIYITFRLILTDTIPSQLFLYDDFFKFAFEVVDSLKNEILELSRVSNKKLVIHGGSMVRINLIMIRGVL